MRKPILAGNWKMHKTVTEAVALAQELGKLTADAKDVDIVVCPTFTSLFVVREALSGTNIKLGAQNMHWEKQGAFTGEISPGMLKDVGCQYVIIGHSERRQYFAETDQTVNHKLKAAFANEITPIFCVGETLEQRESGTTEAVVCDQVRAGLAGLSAEQVASMVIAYEPIWAIGTGRTASADDANAVCRFIRITVAKLFGQDSADKVRIQYGGSVKADNIAELMAKSDIDGALVGGAALDAVGFSKIVKF
ncbi:triosephosphate isomerase [Sporomusaceae bacterium FL31]|nr:triosephosphate isomerase [Sporomusaceae bacterium FL31]GCE33772.1 triosephosphate isomerase [Sporomusaceae bacterium]